MSEGRLKAFKNRGRDLAVSLLIATNHSLSLSSIIGHEAETDRYYSGTEKGTYQ